MSLTAATRLIQYTLSGSGQTLPTTFKFFDTTDLKVTKTVAGVDTVLTMGLDYSVTGGAGTSGTAATGNVVMVAGTAGDVVTIEGNEPQTQLTDLTLGGPFPATTMTGMVDRLTILVQQLQNRVSRSFSVPNTLAAITPPTLAQRISSVVGFDASGNPTYITTASLVAGGSSAGANLVNAGPASGGAAAATYRTLVWLDIASALGGAVAVGGALTVSTAITLGTVLTLGGSYSFGALPSGATTVGTSFTNPASTYTVTGTNTATAFQASYNGVPTFTDASAGTVTDLFSEVWAGPAANAGSLVATRKHTLGILDSTSATSSITGAVIIATAFGTTATSVGIGGGNIFAGGTITGALKSVGASSLGALGSGVPTVVQNTNTTNFNASEMRALDSSGNTTAGISFRNLSHGGSGSSDIFIFIRNSGTLASAAQISSSGLAVVSGFGCNGAAAQTAVASGGALSAYAAGANGYSTAGMAQGLYNLVVSIRAALVANGIMS